MLQQTGELSHHEGKEGKRTCGNCRFYYYTVRGVCGSIEIEEHLCTVRDRETRPDGSCNLYMPAGT